MQSHLFEQHDQSSSTQWVSKSVGRGSACGSVYKNKNVLLINLLKWGDYIAMTSIPSILFKMSPRKN